TEVLRHRSLLHRPLLRQALHGAGPESQEDLGRGRRRAGCLRGCCTDSGGSGSCSNCERRSGRGGRAWAGTRHSGHAGRSGGIPDQARLPAKGCLAGHARLWWRSRCRGFHFVCGSRGLFWIDSPMSSDATLTLTLDSRDEAVLLFGNRDQYLRLIRDALEVRIIARGNVIQIEGPDERVAEAERVFAQLRKMLQHQGRLTPEDVRTVLEIVGQGNEAALPQGLTFVEGSRHVRPRTDGQARYVRAMRESDLTLCIGPGGTGKTFLAVAIAVSMLRQAQVKKIALVRPAVEAGERLGFLPGDIAAKVNPYLRPLFDALNDMMEPDQVKRYMESDIIEIVPLAYMRGRTLNQAVIILDEGQNTTIPQMKMFLTRMGNGSKIIVTGDITQVDLPRQMRSGLIDAVHRLRDLDQIAIIYLNESDIVRHPLVQKIVRAYEEDKARKK